MNWSETRRKLLQVATRRAARRVGDRVASAQSAAAAASGASPRPQRVTPGLGPFVRAASLCVASGKGGTGKSVVTASLASLISSRGRTLIVDADLGVGNAHILQDVSPPNTIVDVVEGRLPAHEARVACSGQIDLLAGGSGVPRMAGLTSYEMHLVASGIEELERDYRFLLVDSAAGVSSQTLAFARACDVTLIVTTPDLTSMTDAYAFLKVLSRGRVRRPLLLVNRARDAVQAAEVSRRIGRVSERFLGAPPKFLGWVPDDPEVPLCVNRRGPVALLEPSAPASRGLRRAAVAILEELASQHPGGMGRRLLNDVGYVGRAGGAG